MNKKLFVALLIASSALTASYANATVGGPTTINTFTYNHADESVYYISRNSGGRGCPPVLNKLSLNSGKSDIVFSCSDGEDLMFKNNYDYSAVSNKIADLTRGFKELTPINLKKNNIFVDVDFNRTEKYKEIDDVLRTHFIASVYQDGIKITDLPIAGCNLDQPFTFAGYAIPGFNKKIVLLSSTKGDCFEGGYIYETLHMLGGVDNLDKTYAFGSYYKSGILIPNEATLVVYEQDSFEPEKIPETAPNNSNENIVEENSEIDVENTSDKKTSTSTVLIALLIAVFAGIIIGRLFSKNTNKK